MTPLTIFNAVSKVLEALGKLVVPEVVKPIATCATRLLTQTVEGSAPKKGRAPKPAVVGSAVESFARLWTAMVTCFPTDLKEVG
jgi:hypothetical protein